jgi:hypothetical protein
MRENYGVSIGSYSYGPCFEPEKFGAGTKVGRYLAIAPGGESLPSQSPD